ncbi:helix-turn-helix domain-containing protein [Actinomadura sp. NPDC047616]|uniref:GlxA family transcriptional regulator n=1 Tax=Actinomadura sp. NPDC047616 TaxID=3155914 RepID=UPI0033C4602F
MAVFRDDGRHRVAVLVRHGVLPMELGLVHQLFGTATAPDGSPLYEVVTCSTTPGPVRTDADFAVTVPHGPEALGEADTVIVPASHEEDEKLRPGALPEPLAEALARVRPSARVASVCTGAFVLAAAGLLDGCPATTHWMSCDLFARTFPDVTVDAAVLYTDAGRVLTSAGEAAGIDLVLHMIRGDHGAAVATAVARRTVVPPHREGGQAQYIPRPLPEPGVTSTSRARAWALENLHRPLTLRDLASREAMSVRTFTRRFREEVGTSPGRWLTRRRVDLARRLLEETDLTVDQIAERAGFGTGASLRRHLQDALGVAPTAYRATFRGQSGP